MSCQNIALHESYTVENVSKKNISEQVNSQFFGTFSVDLNINFDFSRYVWRA